MKLEDLRDGDIIVVHKRFSLKNHKLTSDFKHFARLMKRRFPKKFITEIKKDATIDNSNMTIDRIIMKNSTYIASLNNYFTDNRIDIITFRRATQREEFLYHLYGPHILGKE